MKKNKIKFYPLIQGIKKESTRKKTRDTGHGSSKEVGNLNQTQQRFGLSQTRTVKGHKKARLGEKLLYHTGHQLRCTDVLFGQAELEKEYI